LARQATGGQRSINTWLRMKLPKKGVRIGLTSKQKTELLIIVDKLTAVCPSRRSNSRYLFLHGLSLC
jgi:hypothetical protein